MKSAPTIAFDYRPSREVACLAVVVSFAAILAPWLSGLPIAAQAAISTCTLLFAIGSLAAFSKPRFRRIAYQASGWTLVDRSGTELQADLVAHATLGPWLMLDFRDSQRRRFRALLGPGNVDAQTRRRLILLLARAEVAQAG